jgi:membrane protease subunit HflK
MSNEHSHSEHGTAPDHAHDATARPGDIPAPVPGVEDAGAQALSEALQSSFKIVKFLMVALVVAFFASGFFTVKPNEVAIKLRFGRPVGVGSEQLLAPGPHWSLPYPIEEIVRVPVGESRTITSTAGWYHVTDEEAASGQEPQPMPSLRPGVDGYTLTGDGNIIHVLATLSYRISDPISYAFNFTDTTNLLQHVLDNALFYASARFTADDALYRNKLGFQETVLSHVTRSIDALKLGVTIEPREVDARPPLYVRAAFDEVLKAQQQGDIKIQEAETFARGATNRALGEASVIVQDGVTRGNSQLQIVAADADRFQKLLPLYEADPGLYRQRLLAETWGRVLTNAQSKFFIPRRVDGKPRELRLQLGKEPDVPVRETARP